VSASNDAPVAADDEATTAEDTPARVHVLLNDADPDGDGLTVADVSAVSHGVVTLSGGQLTYTPGANFAGTDSFMYTVADGHGGTATATVTVTVAAVDDPPVAEADLAAGAEDTVVVIDVTGNDSDPDGTAVRVVGVSQPAHGAVSIVAEGVYAGSLTYAPMANFAGTDSFTYTISGGGRATATATVTVTIAGLNDLPIAVDDVAGTAAGTPLVIDVTANDVDVDGDALTVAAISAPVNGTAVFAAGQVTYTPGAGFAGVDTLTYTILDGSGGTATATVQVVVAAAAESPGLEEY
jgi:VCBS repeat-containing protein